MEKTRWFSIWLRFFRGNPPIRFLLQQSWTRHLHAHQARIRGRRVLFTRAAKFPGRAILFSLRFKTAANLKRSRYCMRRGILSTILSSADSGFIEMSLVHALPVHVAVGPRAGSSGRRGRLAAKFVETGEESMGRVGLARECYERSPFKITFRQPLRTILNSCH